MRVALIGYGKMGKAIEEILLANGHQVHQTFNSSKPVSQKDLQGADVAIEFSTPQNAEFNIKICFSAGVPVVVGTTGWDDKIQEIKSSKRKPILEFLWPLTLA